MPPSKTSSGLCAPRASATIGASELFSKSKSSRMASSQGVPLPPNTQSLCASLEAIVRSVSKPRRSFISKAASRRKEPRRSSKSPPPLTLIVNFPSSSTTSSTEPAPLPPPKLDTGILAPPEPTRIADPPRPKARPDNDLSNFLARRRAAPDEAVTTSESASAPPPPVPDSPPVQPADAPAATIPHGAPRPSKSQRRSHGTTPTVEANNTAPAPAPRVQAFPPLHPTSVPATSTPGTIRTSRSQRRKIRRMRVYARLQLEALPATPTIARTGAPSGADPAPPPDGSSSAP
jgi:hypothetical protein